MVNKFSSITECERCSDSLRSRMYSFFTKEILCSGCSATERELKRKLTINGIDPLKLEGCGYIPKVGKVSSKENLEKKLK